MEKCNSIVLANTVDLIKKLLTIIQIIGPIACIIGLTILFTKLMADPDNKELHKKIKNTILALFFLFMIPFAINLMFKILGYSSNLSACWNETEASTGGYTSSDEEDKRKPVISGDDSFQEGNKDLDPTPTPSPSTPQSTTQGTTEAQSTISGNGKLIKKEETPTLKVYIYKVGSHYETKIWASNAYTQMNKMVSPEFGSKLYRPGALLNKAINQKGLSNKLVVGFNASGFYQKDVYDADSVKAYPKYDKTSVGTLVISDGKVIRNATNYAVKTWYVAGIDQANNMRIFEDKKTSNSSEKSSWANQVIATIRNTYTFASPLVENYQASSNTTSMPSPSTSKNRQAFCQIDTHNFLFITGDGLSRKSLIDIMLKEKCKTGTNFDGGGSIALLFKSANSTNIETIVGNRRSLSEVGYFSE